MKDEIIQKFLNKEIYILQDNSDLSLTINDILLDYITNLQEENERLKETIENLTTMTVNGDRTQIKNTAQHKLEKAQSKIDKAINYINTWLVDEYSIAVPSKENPDVFCEYEPNAIEKLLNILNGGDEE